MEVLVLQENWHSAKITACTMGVGPIINLRQYERSIICVALIRKNENISATKIQKFF
jgi:hypothetical protein